MNQGKLIISNREYLNDYSLIKSQKIDMTLSGKYLYKYPFKFIKCENLDKYINQKDVEILKNNIKGKFKLKENKEVILGPGVNGLIQNILKVLLKYKCENIVTPYLSFNQAEYCASSYNCNTKRSLLNKDYSLNLENIEQSIDKSTKIVYICNPNNPTGLYIETSKIIKLAQKYKEVYFIIDESSIEFSNEKSIIENYDLSETNNIIVLRSFSKAYGIANLRIGYFICDKMFSNIYKTNITTNEYSGVSCIYANKVFNSNYYQKNVQNIIKEKKYMENELKKLDISVIKSESNTIFTNTIFKDEFIKKLEENNISVLPVYDQNNNLHIRIATQDNKMNEKFIKRLKKIKNLKNYILEV